MAKRNPVVRDLIQRPPRGAGKHKDRRKELRANQERTNKEPSWIQQGSLEGSRMVLASI
jgi:hypothetical protein